MLTDYMFMQTKGASVAVARPSVLKTVDGSLSCVTSIYVVHVMVFLSKAVYEIKRSIIVLFNRVLCGEIYILSNAVSQ